MLQFGIPGGPALLLLLVLFAVTLVGLLSVLAVVGVVVFLVLRSGSEPDESAWDSGNDADREPVETVGARADQERDPTGGSDTDR